MNCRLAHPLRDAVGRGKNLLGLLVEQQVVVAEVRPRQCQWKFLVLMYRANWSASSALSASVSSSVASACKPVGVLSGAALRPLVALTSVRWALCWPTASVPLLWFMDQHVRPVRARDHRGIFSWFGY